VPINPALIDEFDPEGVPTVGDLLNELDHLPAAGEVDEKARRVEGT
jgi:DNA primase small subunit